MHEPKTLLQMAGASTQPSRIDDSALVLIDCQREYVDGKLALPGVKPALEEAGRILSLARVGGAPIIHIVHHAAAGGGAFDPTTSFVDIAEPVQPRKGEAIIVKNKPNSFAGTDLDARLKALGKKELIVVGFMTHMCVSSTVRAALDFGYRCTVVANAAATRDLPDGHGGVVDADSLHRMELAALADRFAVVVDDVKAWAG
ncbi:MAG TPA: cysteine hydrolase family protein [Alphaproteobacteria bacterium]|jgi:nicotinamidase-related amidase|nr:cysteine hydrolase family protein [Alphaproteobacteria bacterium]